MALQVLQVGKTVINRRKRTLTGPALAVAEKSGDRDGKENKRLFDDLD